MNVKFRVLWFEDTRDWFKNEKENVEDLLRNHCLVPEIDWFDGEDITEEKITDPKYDLILMDYMLAEEKKGDEIAHIIRSHKVLTDILFYSSNTEEMHKAIKAGIPDLDGIYITKRDTKTFKDKVAGVIKKIIKRSEDIVNLRGFVLDNTSDFENRITELLSKTYGLFIKEDKELLNNKMQNKITKYIQNRQKNLADSLASEDFFDSVNKDHTLTDISTKLSVFQEVINLLKTKFSMPEALYIVHFREYYMDMVGSYRNQLGHAKADDQYIRIFGKEELIDEKLHEKLRKNVVEVDETIKNFEIFVNSIM